MRVGQCVSEVKSIIIQPLRVVKRMIVSGEGTNYAEVRRKQRIRSVEVSRHDDVSRANKA